MHLAQSWIFESMNIKAFKVTFTREKIKLQNYRSFWEGLPKMAKVLPGKRPLKSWAMRSLSECLRSVRWTWAICWGALKDGCWQSLEIQLRSTDSALFIQTVPEVTAAPYQREKGQLPVLASAQLTVTQKSLQASAGAGVFLQDAPHLSGIGRCRWQRSLMKSTEFNQTFAVAFFSKLDGTH